MNKYNLSAPLASQKHQRFTAYSMLAQAADIDIPKINYSSQAPHQAPSRLIALREVCTRIGRSKAWFYTMWKLQREGKLPLGIPLPEPIVISGRNYWVAEEVENFIAELVKHSRKEANQSAVNGKTRREVTP